MVEEYEVPSMTEEDKAEGSFDHDQDRRESNMTDETVVVSRINSHVHESEARDFIVGSNASKRVLENKGSPTTDSAASPDGISPNGVS